MCSGRPVSPRMGQDHGVALRGVIAEGGREDLPGAPRPQDRGRGRVPEDQETTPVLRNDEARGVLDGHDRDGAEAGRDGPRGHVEGGQEPQTGVVQVEGVARVREPQVREDRVARGREQDVPPGRVHEDQPREVRGCEAGAVEGPAGGLGRERGHGPVTDPVARPDARAALDLLRGPVEAREGSDLLRRDLARRDEPGGSQDRNLEHPYLPRAEAAPRSGTGRV